MYISMTFSPLYLHRVLITNNKLYGYFTDPVLLLGPAGFSPDTAGSFDSLSESALKSFVFGGIPALKYSPRLFLRAGEFVEAVPTVSPCLAVLVATESNLPPEYVQRQPKLTFAELVGTSGNTRYYQLYWDLAIRGLPDYVYNVDATAPAPAPGWSVARVSETGWTELV